MIQNKNYPIRGRAYIRMFLFLCMMFAVQSSWADNFMQNPANYTAIVQGIDKIRFTLPTQFDSDTQNEGIRYGHVYYTVGDDTQLQSLLSWGLGNDYNVFTDKHESGRVRLFVSKGGTWQLLGKTMGGYKYFTNDVEYTLGPNDDDIDHYSTVVEWTIPRDMRGKKYKFYLFCRIDDTTNHWFIPSNSSSVSSVNDTYKLAEWDTPDAAEVGISINEPMLSYNTDLAGTLLFPYVVQAKEILGEGVVIHYTDAETGTSYSKTLSTKLADFAYLPADRPWKDIYISANVKDSENYGTTAQSEKLASNMVHFPRNLQAKLQPNGTVSLSWTVVNANWDDFDDSDFFEVQRNVNGTTNDQDEGWTTIAMEEQFAKGKSNYSYIDNTLLDRYKNKPVAYRVRRTSTTLWNWKSGSGSSLCTIPAVLALPGFTEAFAQRTTWNDDEHVVKFNYVSGPKYDSEGRFIVRNDNDWSELRNMVKDYQWTYDKAVMTIVDEEDWTKFCERVNWFAPAMSGVLLGDVNIGDRKDKVGQEAAFKGSFDGFGHTLTVNYVSNSEYLAPFMKVDGGTIKNLTIAGKITSSGKYASGLIGKISGRANIERCAVKAEIISNVDGDASSGGLVGLMLSSTTVNINNSAFLGSIQGEKSRDNGGFIGVAVGNCSINMSNCLFAPISLPFNMAGCATFARHDETATATLDHCYYTKMYGQYEHDNQSYYVINSSKDWKTFADLVENSAKGTQFNAILAADITVSDMVGSDAKPFCGIFDGNGHTIHANINTDLWAAAPFRIVGNVTIKNLHVAGSVTGGRHAAGLIGSRDGTPDIHVEKVWVSANVTTTDRYLGGIIGHVGGANAYVSDTRFDGKLTGTPDSYGAKNSYGGAIIGWGGEGGWFFHRVYDYSTASNVYWYFYCIDTLTGDPVSWGGNGVSTNTVTWNSWTNPQLNHNIDDQNEVLSLMNGEVAGSWHMVNGMAVPVLSSVEISSQGTSASLMSLEELKTALGNDQWYESDNILHPVMEGSKDNAYCITMWDNRAKLMLYSKMKGENSVTTNVVDLSGNADAINKHEFTYNLTRKCVDYDFELVVKRGTSPLMIAGSDADTLAYQVTKKEGADVSYKFMNMNNITAVAYEKKQSSVRLAWEVSGGESDFYRVLRREHTTDAYGEWTDTIATNLIQQFYEDKTVLVQQAYDYLVESVLQCEGTHISSAQLLGAECIPTGRISGYVRMADGTAIAGVEVLCEPKNISGATTQSTTTDEAGFFEFSGLPYQGAGTYVISIKGGGYTGPNSTGEVNFSQNSNWTQGFNYYMDNYYIYSGNVFYRDTSIPVPGVSFKLDGNVMHDANQKVIVTDTQGAFSLSIPAGGHSVQAVKEGHYFANDGFLLNPDPVPGRETEYNFNTNVSNVYLWDSTTVVLRGRVVGGDDQGKLPLGESMSVNNLGDSIKIVMQLEGDNASYLIRKQDDETVKTADFEYTYGLDNRDTTQVHVTRHSMTIRPDKNTGEYLLTLHPAKYKVIEISAQGYATLFQEGKVGETLDLTFNVKGDTCEYNRIYHAVPTVEVKQFNAGDEPYFGVKKVTASDNIGNKSVINTWYWKKTSDTDSIGVYSFNYPVFMSGSPYGWMLQACEKYYKNNNINEVPDIVKLKGGKVTIQNGLISGTDNKEITLDEDGGASYVFTPKNTTALQTDESALMNVSITLEYDNTFFDIKPMNGEIFKAYVMATVAKPEGRKSVASGLPQLVDVLRDPPGGNSSAYLEAGSKLSYSYNADLSGSAGVTFNLTQGNNANIYNGVVIIPSFGTTGSEAGTFMDTSKKNVFSIDAITYYSQGWNFSYNFDVTERIQTMSGKKWVGAKADLFMGMTTEVMVEDAIALRVLPDSMYQIYKTHEGGTFQATDGHGNTANVKVQTGTAKVLVEGVDDTGQPIYLIRDEVMALGPKLASTFVHSQHYIENELIPELIKLRNSLILPVGTSADYAKQLANRKGCTTYVSKVAEDDVSFGYKDSYVSYEPNEGLHTDSIMSLNRTVEAWLFMLSENERQKIEVSENDLVKRYDFDGAANIQYSESFSAVNSETRSLRYPGINDLGQVTNGLLTALQTFIKAAKHWNEINGKNVDNDPYYDCSDGLNGMVVETKAGGSYLSLKIVPTITLNFTDKNGTSQTNSKKIGFTLSASSKSSMTVDVYRTANEQTMNTAAGSFGAITADLLDMLRTGKLDSNPTDYLDNREPVYSSFVYRTRGGVTCEPYEKEYASKWYQPGTIVDVATIPADKPRIWIDEPVVSNVPFDEPARFTLHMANESDYPERASLVFNYFLLASSNPDGAKVFVDGNPITSAGTNITLYPCRDNNNEVMVFTKQIELYPGQEFDYNDLTMCLYDPEDPNRVFSCNFSAHFVPAAGKVNVSSPGNNWVVNTESPYDGKRQAWYLPVKIDGFDTNYRGFDHIELQYKLSTQGDKDWVNVCSYYADRELMEKASGVTDTIPANGTIIAPFYGEVDPIEQYYDIRAVNYCRHGNGFLTRSSEILKGIKDTRLPVAFGTPEPTDGILDIGDDIIVKFSEPVAGNYLRKINNFEMLGTKNSNDVTTSTSLTFGDMSLAVTQGTRNLSGKSFTVDVMLDPADEQVPMTVFSHGGEEKGVLFGLTADRKLMATINGQTVESDKAVPFNHALREVAYALDQSGDDMTVNFYDQCDLIGTKTLTGKYEGSSVLKVGFNSKGEDLYQGDMLEFRLWNRAMTTNELDAYGRKTLTGYEAGLLDYYPLNEGEGMWSYDKAPGSMDLMLVGTTWKRPAGLSIALKGDKGMMLNPDKFERSKIHDYTLMFWFRTLQSDGTLLSNGPALNESQWKNHFNIGLEEGRIYYRNGKFEVKNSIDKRYNDGAWHHMAVTVNRARNVGNLYVDQNLVQSFAVDTLGGILGGTLAAGITYEDAYTTSGGLAGNIDELALYEMTLPVNVIKDYASMMPSGREMGTLVYLPFSRSEKQKDNTQRLVASGESIKQTRDNQGNYSTRMDVIVPDSVMDKVSDRENYAPIDNTGQRENLNYSYVTDNQNLLINIDEPAQNMEKTHVYITVRDVADLNGNLLESPVMMDLYVYRNPLRWSEKRLNIETYYGYGSTVDVVIKNMSGKTHTYYIENQPLWIKPSKTSGTIGATDEETITLDISPYINIGDFDEMLNLVSEEGLSEVLPIHIKVRGESPDWAISESLKKKNITMNMVARVKIDGIVADDPEDIIGVFGNNHEPLGVAHLNVDNTANANEPLAFITVYNNNLEQQPLRFEYYDCTTGRISVLKREDGEELVFYPDSILGSTDNPIMLVNSGEEVQMMQLRKGWNWVSFYMKPEKNTISNLLNRSTKWEVGDAVEVLGTNGFYEISYKGIPNPDNPTRINYFWDNGNDSIELDATRMYRIYSCSDKTAYLSGQRYDDFIQVSPGWNRIAYISHLNLPIANALADYTAKATVGDIIKSQSEFSMLVEDTQGNRMWKGTLTHLTVGQGYMLKHLGNNDFIFYYPSYEGSTRYGSVQYKAPRYENNTGSSMNIVARTAGVDLQEGDCLVAYNGAELCGVAEKSDDDLFFLSVADYGSNDLSFAIQRGEELIALSSNQMTYQTNGVIGTVNEPTVINFAEVSHQLIGEWYDLQGRKLDKRPQTPGIYIFNGQKILIK